MALQVKDPLPSPEDSRSLSSCLCTAWDCREAGPPSFHKNEVSLLSGLGLDFHDFSKVLI